MTIRPARALPFLLLCLVAPLKLAAQASPDVAITGGLSAHTIRGQEPVQFTITIRNKSDAKANPPAALQNVTLLSLPDGYTLGETVCVLPQVPPSSTGCDGVKVFADRQRVLAASLAPGQSLTVQGYLKPNSPHKSAALTAVISWSVAGSGLPSSQAVTLGDNQVQKTSQATWTWLNDFVKLLAIPILLAIVGYVLNLLNRKHDERIAATQAERQAAQHQHELQQAAAQRENEQQQAVRAETWKQMLLISHQYAARCYLPLSLAASRLASNLRALHTADGDERLVFFYILLCGREMTNTRQQTGGFYFKDLRGETLASECWRKHRDRLMGANEEGDFNLAIRYAVEAVEEGHIYAIFKRKYEVLNSDLVTFNHPDLQTAWTLFRAWLAANADTPADVARYLEGFSAVLDYESNRPYEYWYPTSPQLLVSEETEQTLREILAEEDFSQAEIDDYFINRKRA